MPANEPAEDGIDWRLTTWDGSRREQLRRWAALPLERIILAIEEMEDLAEHFRRIRETDKVSAAGPDSPEVPAGEAGAAPPFPTRDKPE